MVASELPMVSNQLQCDSLYPTFFDLCIKVSLASAEDFPGGAHVPDASHVLDSLWCLTIGKNYYNLYIFRIVETLGSVLEHFQRILCDTYQ